MFELHLTAQNTPISTKWNGFTRYIRYAKSGVI